MSPTPDSPADINPAPLWRRFAAMLYDLLPLIGLWIVASGLWVLAFHGVYDPQHPQPVLHALLSLWLLVVTAAYFVVSWVRVGASIGMRAWRVKLVREAGTRIDTRTATLRFVLALVSLAVVGCGFWYACFDADRRTWHDRVCGTRMTRF
ncbi:MAG TPA: RDD family protein [Rhodanobacteraceae bacterium]|nr:RDD family protein [Rhodanobacteraceae bacterium]